jgi:hypothetical protein
VDRAPARSGLFRERIRRWLTHAGGRNKAVHAKVLHHLSVVVGGVRKAENGQRQERIERDRDRQLVVQRCERITIVERRHGFVTHRKRVFEVLKNLLFRLQVVGSVCRVLHADTRWRTLPEYRTGDDEVRGRYLRNLEREGPNPAEFCSGRCEGVPVVWHTSAATTN